MIHEEAATDPGARVDVESGEEAGDLVHESREELQSRPMERMGEQAVERDGVKAGIEDRLGPACRRVVPDDRLEVAAKAAQRLGHYCSSFMSISNSSRRGITFTLPESGETTSVYSSLF